MYRCELILGIVACLAVLGTSGCVPATYVEVPALRGRVVTGPDLKPVNGAVVHVVRDKDQAEMGTVTTRPDGTFERSQQSRLGVQFAGADLALTIYSVTAVSGMRHSPTTQVSDGVRRWFLVYYDPPLDRDLGTLEIP